MANLKTGNFKQKNKKFKGNKHKRTDKKYKAGLLAHKIKKEVPEKREKIDHSVQKKPSTEKLLETFQKSEFSTPPEVKVILFFSLNEANVEDFVNQFSAAYFEEADESFKVFDPKFSVQTLHKCCILKQNSTKRVLKAQRYVLIVCPRQLELLGEYTKVADVLIALTTSSFVDQQRINTVPHEALNAVDEVGIQALNLIKCMGLPQPIAVVLDGERIAATKKKNFKFYYRRLLSAELENANVYFMDEPAAAQKLVMELQNIKHKQNPTKENRGYFLADCVCVYGDEVLLSGYLRSPWAVDQAVHLTGLGDFYSVEAKAYSPEGTVVLNVPPMAESSYTPMIIESEAIEQEEETDELGELVTGMANMRFTSEYEREEGIREQNISDESSSSDDDLNDTVMSRSNAALTLNRRAESEKEFPDEAEFPPETLLRERLSKYRFMDSFVKNEWDKYV